MKESGSNRNEEITGKWKRRLASENKEEEPKRGQRNKKTQAENNHSKSISVMWDNGYSISHA